MREGRCSTELVARARSWSRQRRADDERAEVRAGYVLLHFQWNRRHGGAVMASAPASSPTVEEALRSAAARFALLADVLELQALGIERADQPVGPEGARALAETCRQAVGDLQRLLTALPVDLLNWSDAATRTRGRHP